ncbi:sugar phosphate isomerase/epimerase [uncultured Alistipes sp.]|uniref:sugar phosphate isomerase/epimerase family protein n=1 Tax=uncultured Alistipes sp. TaxID=538949 RepID=UPI0026251B4A|nr:sugar phosphate isomerase/epimerase family protein [uncultured Alistipes sp.]
MKRREFLKASLLGGAAAAVAPMSLLGGCTEGEKKKTAPELKISFQEGTAPGDTLEERLDFMEQNGVVGFEPGGVNLAGRINEFDQLLRGRNIKVSAICAGFQGFILSEDAAVREQFDRTIREIIAAAGQLGSTGVIMVPAFNAQVPVMPHTMDTRKYLVEQLCKLGDYAVECGTTVILEPLNRNEAFYLRQVGDAASICRDADHPGVRCMGDFWHMTFEEPSNYGALMSGGEYLQHVHIASRGSRNTPGEDGDADNYVDGFRALKEMNYPHYVSFECGCKGDKAQSVPAALQLIREQWERA